MKTNTDNNFNKVFSLIASKITNSTGSPTVVLLAFLLVIIWGAFGPIFSFSDQWQLVINTTTTIITFIMVFIIQHSQNKDTAAIQIKLNELIAANKFASNRLVNSEDLTENELKTLKKFYQELSDSAEKANDLFTSHSVDEARENNEEKKQKNTL